MVRKVVNKEPPKVPEVLDTAYQKGYAAFQVCQQRKGHFFATANPMKPRTLQHKEWQRGYDVAYSDNYKRLMDEQAKTRS